MYIYNYNGIYCTLQLYIHKPTTAGHIMCHYLKPTYVTCTSRTLTKTLVLSIFLTTARTVNPKTNYCRFFSKSKQFTVLSSFHQITRTTFVACYKIESVNSATESVFKNLPNFFCHLDCIRTWVPNLEHLHNVPGGF